MIFIAPLQINGETTELGQEKIIPQTEPSAEFASEADFYARLRKDFEDKLSSYAETRTKKLDDAIRGAETVRQRAEERLQEVESRLLESKKSIKELQIQIE